jgi:hypothetical protein
MVPEGSVLVVNLLLILSSMMISVQGGHLLLHVIMQRKHQYGL